jgi:gas vesicle protein
MITHGNEWLPRRKEMTHEYQEYKGSGNTIIRVLTGVLVGGVAGAVAMLLLAPQSGKETRTQLQKKGIELRDRTNEIVDNTMAQVRTQTDKMAVSGREKIKELTQRGQGIAIEQLEHVSEVAQAGKKAIQSS